MNGQLGYKREQRDRHTQRENKNKSNFSLECFYLPKYFFFCILTDSVPDTGVINIQDAGKEERHTGNWILKPEIVLKELIYREKEDANFSVVSPNNNNNNNNYYSDDNR